MAREPGYLGLEWLRMTEDSALVGLDISPDLIELARHNASEYGLDDRTEYVLGRGDELPFDDEAFDAVFTNGSLHEWAEPDATLDEMWRVLRPDGRLFVCDLRRDMMPPVRWFLYFATKPREIRPGLLTSIRAAYTPAEIEDLVARCAMCDCASVSRNPLGLTVTACKQA